MALSQAAYKLEQLIGHNDGAATQQDLSNPAQDGGKYGHPTEKMKALVFTGIKRIEWRDWPQPKLSPGDALVKVGSVGVCGSDVHGWLGKSRGRVPPLVLGHEMAGTVDPNLHPTLATDPAPTAPAASLTPKPPTTEQ